MLKAGLLGSLMAISGLVGAAGSTLASDASDCNQSNDAQRRIKGCTALIVQDFLAITFNQVSQESDLSSPGGREFYRLKAIDDRLRAETDPLAIFRQLS